MSNQAMEEVVQRISEEKSIYPKVVLMVVMVVVEGTSYFEGTSSFGLYYTLSLKSILKRSMGHMAPVI